MKDDGTKQRRYRRRYDDGGIAPNVEISSRAQEALRRRAITYGVLTPTAAKDLTENPKQNRQWMQRQVFGVLEELADEWLGK
jgi:hypothetical protein